VFQTFTVRVCIVMLGVKISQIVIDFLTEQVFQLTGTSCGQSVRVDSVFFVIVFV